VSVPAAALKVIRWHVAPDELQELCVLLISDVIAVLCKELGGLTRHLGATHLSYPLNELLK
jgi:hypothetical protein